MLAGAKLHYSDEKRISLLGKGILRAATSTDSVIVDNGTSCLGDN